MSDIKISDMQPWVGAVTGNVEFPAVFGNENYRIALSQLSTSTFGFGSMALQNSDAVIITGGNIAVTALSGAITVANGGTGLSTAPQNGELLIGNGTNYTLSTLTAGSGITITNAAGTITIAATGGGSGTVTSVGMSVPTGLQVTGSPITTSGTLAVTFQSGYSIPTTASQANWDVAYADRLQWDGGATNLVASTGRISLGATTVGSNFFTLANPGAVTFPRINADNTVSTLTAANFRTAIGAGTGNGTVTSVDASGGTTGLTFSGGPIATSGTLTLSGTLDVDNGGTGQTSYTDGQLLIGNSTGNTLTKSTLTAGSGISITNGAGSITIAATGGGTVTSVAMTVPTGLQVSGSPITTSGTLAVTLQSGYSIPTTASQANWDTAYSERLQWDGGSTNLVAATGRTSLGATTVGGSFFTLTNPSAITFPRINADNSVSALTATNFRTAIGAGTGDGTVTSVGGTGSVNGITLTGTVTSSGSLTLGGTLSNVSLTTQVTGTLPVGNGGTGVATTPTSGQLLIGNGTGYSLSTLTAGSGVTITNGAGTITISATGGGSGTVTSVDASGGTTGLTFTGGPITTSGTLTLGGTLDVDNGGTGQTTYTDGQILIGNSTGNTLTKSTITAGSGISITNGAGSITIAATGGTGTVTSVDVSGGTTGLSFTGGPVTTSGTITMSGTLDVDNGGTGQTSYTDGQLLIGNSTGNTLTKATLTAGSGISITNGSGSITIAATGGGSGTVTSVDVSGGTTGLSFSGGPITTSGTITMAGTLDADNGGTGISSYTTGDILYASGATTLAKLADVATGNALISGGVSTAPSWGKIGLTTHVSGTLPVGNGGTGVASTPTNGQLLIGNGTGFSLATLTAGTNITITNSAGGITIDAAGGGGSLLGQTDSASPFETSLGYQAGNVNTGDGNTFLGYQSGLVHTSGLSNTAVGYFSLKASTTGNYNVAIGAQALLGLTTGQQNAAVGYRALEAITTGSNNIAFGVESLYKATSNARNTGIGVQSLTSLLGGAYNDNTGVGYASLRSQTSSSGNAALGTYSGYNITTGANNTVVGYNAANSGTNNLTTGSNNIIIGYNAAASSATVSNEITLGDTNITAFRIPGLSVSWTANTVPYRNVPAVGTKTASYTLAVADVGKYVELSTGSAAVVPNSTFANGDIVSLFNNTSGNITITLNTTDAYIAGNNTNKGGGGTMTLATRGVASILFISGTLCVVSGNVS